MVSRGINQVKKKKQCYVINLFIKATFGLRELENITEQKKNPLLYDQMQDSRNLIQTVSSGKAND